ncbi:hypothetical protein [Streptomyces sediminimaris]|uniref:hypothetical protein n=1 Tax=Streptomyces sediminimaris TaxID=3383721 RepID=UPI00399B7D98
MIDLEPRRDTLGVLGDQRGQPTWSADVTGRLAVPGPHPGARRGCCSPCPRLRRGRPVQPAREIFRGPGTGPGRKRPVRSGAVARPAPRPAYGAPAPGRRQEFGLPPQRDRRATLHGVLTLIRKESLRETP